MRDTGKIVTAFLLAVALFLQTGMVGEATSTKTQQQIDSLKKQQQETQDKLDDAESEKKKLEAAKTKLCIPSWIRDGQYCCRSAWAPLHPVPR